MRFASCTQALDTRCAELRIDFRHAHRGHIDKAFPMVTRQERINDFYHEGTPPADQAFQILCEDHAGTYVVPFLCRWHDGAWQSVGNDRRIEATVIGWRAPKQSQG
jgi:hypothetical protein